MRFLLSFILIIVLIVLIYYVIQIFKSIPSIKLRKTLKEIFNNLEKEYDELVNQRINLEILNSDDIKLDENLLVTELTKILRPHIDSLIALVNAYTISEPLGNITKTEKFKNLFFLTEKFLTQKTPLTSFEQQEFYKALEDAIRADISKKLLSLKAGILK